MDNGFIKQNPPYRIITKEDKLELMIAAPGVNKKSDIDAVSHKYNNTLTIHLPQTDLANKRTLSFEIGDEYNVKGTKANVRDGIIYIHIPKHEESKPTKIEIE